MVNKFDLIGYLRNFCEDNNIIFISGESEYQNALSDKNIYEPYQLFMGISFDLQPEYGDTGLASVTYQGRIFLGRKMEDSTVSNLDETFQQKYDNRLLDICNIFNDFLTDLQCSEDADILSCNIEYALNQFDINLDGVMATVSIRF